MAEEGEAPGPQGGPDVQELPPGEIQDGREAWRTVYFGQISGELVPFHPEPPEAQEDELTQAALRDAGDVTLVDPQESAPTLWRVLTVLLVAVGALAVVFWK